LSLVPEAGYKTGAVIPKGGIKKGVANPLGDSKNVGWKVYWISKRDGCSHLFFYELFQKRVIQLWFDWIDET